MKASAVVVSTTTKLKKTRRSSKLKIPPLDARPCFFPWILKIKLVKGTGLKAGDSMLHSMAHGATAALSDPMVYLEVDGCVARSSVVSQCLSPKWENESFFFNVSFLQSSPIQLMVYDWDADGQHDFLGKSEFNLQNLPCLGRSTEFELKLKENNGDDGQGSLTVQLQLDANFNLGEDLSKPLYFIKQIRNVPAELDRQSFVKFVNQLVTLGVKDASWLLISTQQEMCLRLDALLDEKLTQTARRTDLVPSSSVANTLQTMSLEATLEGISEIAVHCGRCLAIAMHASRHAPNLQAILTLVLNVHVARAVSELNRWCFEREDSVAILAKSCVKVSDRLKGSSSSNAFLTVVPEIVRFLFNENEMALEKTNLNELRPGLFETVLLREIGRFDNPNEDCDFEISFSLQNDSASVVRSVRLCDVFDIRPKIMEEVNLNSGAAGSLNHLFCNIALPYEAVIKRIDENTIKTCRGGAISLVCGAGGWGGLDTDWATDCLELMGIQVKLAKDQFSTPSPSVLAAASAPVAHSPWYRTLMQPIYQIVAHSMDAMIYRFLYMFRQLREFEDLEATLISSLSVQDLTAKEVPPEEVNVILDYLCKVIKDSFRVRSRVSTLFDDDNFTDNDLDGLTERLTYSLDALELAAVNQLSYLVSKCFIGVFAPHREIVNKDATTSINFNSFVEWSRQQHSHPLKSTQSGFDLLVHNIQQPTSPLQTAVALQASKFSKLAGRYQSPEREDVSWPQVCYEVCDVLDETVPILTTKLTENDDEHFMIKAKSLISESLTLQVSHFFLKAMQKLNQALKQKRRLLQKSNPDEQLILIACSEFNLAMEFLTSKVVGCCDDDEPKCLGDGPWRSRFDWLSAMSRLLVEKNINTLFSIHCELCDQFKLNRKGLMLDLTIYLCTTIRQIPLKELAPVFSSLLQTSQNNPLNSLAFMETDNEFSGTTVMCNTDISSTLVVSALGVKGMVESLVSQYHISSAKIVLSGVVGESKLPRTAAAINTFKKRISAKSTDLTTFASNPSSKKGGVIGVDGVDEFDDDVENNDCTANIFIELSVEVISALNLHNVDEKHGVMSSPFARVTLVTDYYRSNTKKQAIVKNKSQFHQTVKQMKDVVANPIIRRKSEGRGLLTAAADAIATASTYSPSSSASPSTGEMSSANDMSASNHGSANFDQSEQNEELVNFFCTEVETANLNPRWRKDSHKDSNIGLFRIPLKAHLFFGLALEVDVLTAQNKLLGTAFVDLMEWDESSCHRDTMVKWFPLFLPNQPEQNGSISLCIASDNSMSTPMRETIR